MDKRIYQCAKCGGTFREKDGVSCPYCGNGEVERVRFKLFGETDIFEAYKFAETGGVALHVFGGAAAYPGAPACFKRCSEAGHLFDRDIKRVKELAAIFGVCNVKVSHKGSSKQHVDLCGKPLKKAVEMCEECEADNAVV